jgi:hypothetical protein
VTSGGTIGLGQCSQVHCQNESNLAFGETIPIRAFSAGEIEEACMALSLPRFSPHVQDTRCPSSVVVASSKPLEKTITRGATDKYMCMICSGFAKCCRSERQLQARVLGIMHHLQPAGVGALFHV